MIEDITQILNQKNNNPIMHKFILAAILVSFVYCWQFQRLQMFDENPSSYQNQQQFWFSQILDHYNYDNSNTWQQRYYVFDDYFNPVVGPIILNICGQAQCKGISNTGFIARIAQQTQGLVLSLEHRYYGNSLPFGNQSFSTQNLKYLTVGQALRDLSYFIVKMSKSGQYRINIKSPWIAIGGSYAGAMAAWFRNKYPHLTIGAIGSSGVVLAVEDLKMFDEQIYISAMKSGEYCVEAILNSTYYVQQQITGSDWRQFQAQFNAQKLEVEEFLFYWSDVIVFQIQYGHRENFCNSLKDKSASEQFQIIKELALKVSPADYGAYYLKNQTFERYPLQYFSGHGSRAWIYQSCTQFGFWQTYSDQHPMRSKRLTLDFYKNWCKYIFGTWPFVDRVNNQYGGLNLNVNNLIMTNGDEDPWKWASLQESKKSEIYAKVIKCDNCAHCVDLRGPNAQDSAQLTNTRNYVMNSIKEWISQHWKQMKV